MLLLLLLAPPPVYDALDYCLPGDQQRELCAGLEAAIDRMVSGDGEEEDEGLGEEETSGLTGLVLGLCRARLEEGGQPDSHYR